MLAAGYQIRPVMIQRKRLSVAIIGSGPSGFFAAEALLAAEPNIEIDIIERLPAPFGLIRFGVAPDHQVTKKVTETYEAIAQLSNVRFFGNVEVGVAPDLADMRNFYDAIVLATGAPEDAPLSIPGADLPGVHGCAQFVGWYNGHPDNASLRPNLGIRAAAVLGMGNVALDVTRVLARSHAELETTDISEYALSSLRSSSITDIYVFGRRSPLETRFSNVELREIGGLTEVSRVLNQAQLDAVRHLKDEAPRPQQKNFQVFESFAREQRRWAPKKVHFVFNATPVAVLGQEDVKAIRMRHTGSDNSYWDVACGMVIGAIGFRGRPLPGVPFDPVRRIVPNDNGRVQDALYAVGWIKRGPSGVIGTSKPDGTVAAHGILQEFPQGGSKPGRPAFVDFLARRKIDWIGFDGWKRIDRAERSAARPGSPRQKLFRVADMLMHAKIE